MWRCSLGGRAGCRAGVSEGLVAADPRIFLKLDPRRGFAAARARISSQVGPWLGSGPCDVVHLEGGRGASGRPGLEMFRDWPGPILLSHRLWWDRVFSSAS